MLHSSFERNIAFDIAVFISLKSAAGRDRVQSSRTTCTLALGLLDTTCLMRL